MEELRFNRFRISYDPSDDYPVSLFDDDECINQWVDPYEARMDIDYSPVGDEITIEEWQSLWDWVENLMLI